MSQLFSPYHIGPVTLKNRIVMAPMCSYSVESNDGIPTKAHEIHYGARAMGETGLIIVEATAVEARGRISNRDLGIWNDAQVSAHKNLTDTIHAFGAKAAIQIAHAGRKSECVDSTPIAPSTIPFSDDFKIPEKMGLEEIEKVKESFVMGAKRAKEAGYDLIELHAAHGYLLCEFLSPLSNQRNDQYGGSLESRCRIVVETAQNIIEQTDLPLLVRISADEWMEKGWKIEDSITLSQQLKAVGVSMIHVSAGGNHPSVDHMPPLVPLYQADYAKRIRKEAGIPTIAVGLITTASEGEALLLGDVCDLVGYGRELLRSPNFAMKAATDMDLASTLPPIYQRAF